MPRTMLQRRDVQEGQERQESCPSRVTGATYGQALRSSRCSQLPRGPRCYGGRFASQRCGDIVRGLSEALVMTTPRSMPRLPGYVRLGHWPGRQAGGALLSSEAFVPGDSRLTRLTASLLVACLYLRRSALLRCLRGLSKPRTPMHPGSLGIRGVVH